MDRYKYKPIRRLFPSKVHSQVRKLCCFALLCFRQTSEKARKYKNFLDALQKQFWVCRIDTWFGMLFVFSENQLFCCCFCIPTRGEYFVYRVWFSSSVKNLKSGHDPFLKLPLFLRINPCMQDARYLILIYKTGKGFNVRHTGGHQEHDVST